MTYMLIFLTLKISDKERLLELKIYYSCIITSLPLEYLNNKLTLKVDLALPSFLCHLVLDGYLTAA